MKRNEIIENCSCCEDCLSECRLLAKIGRCPLELAEDGASFEEAYSCAQCGLCAQVCPQELNLGDFFLQRRREAVQKGQIIAGDYADILPGPASVWEQYRLAYSIDYGNLNLLKPGGKAKTVFFPGCGMATYAAQTTGLVFERLKAAEPDLALTLECCGEVSRQLGFNSLWEEHTRGLADFFTASGVEQIITACPNCYYSLKKSLTGKWPGELLTVYSLWGEPEPAKTPLSPAIHDSCPDRFQGIFGEEIRKLLRQAGYTVTELKHHGQQAVCCGSGGQLSHFAPELAEEWRGLRLAEVKQAGSELVAAYCYNCVLNLASYQELKVVHILDLLLNQSQDYRVIRPKIEALWQE